MRWSRISPAKRCQDTGSFEGHTCECIHKLMQKLRREEIEKLSSLSVSSFDTMELRYYPNTMDEKLGEPVRTYMGGTSGRTACLRRRI